MVPRKRLLDHCNDFKLEELCRSHRKLVPAVRDFPPGCGIKEAERKQQKILTKIPSNVGRMVDSQPVETNIFISSKFKAQEIGRNRPYFVSRPAGKVKLYDPVCTKGGYNQKPKVTTTFGMRRKNLDNVDANGSKMSWNGEDKFTSFKLDENGKLKSFEPLESGRNKACFASRSTVGEYKLANSKPDENSKLKSFETDESGRNKAHTASRSTGGEYKLTNSKLDENSKLKSFETDESGRNKAHTASRSTYGEDKLTNSKPVVPVENSKLKSFASMELGRRKTYFASRSTAKVKYWDPTCEAQETEQKSEVASAFLSEKEQIRREKIKEAMSIFEEVHKQLIQENNSKPNGLKNIGCSVTSEAAKIVKQKLKWKDPEKTSGPVCGIQIGDKFRYRSQLVMFGLHCQPYSGIDFVNTGGKNLAISIVDAQRYSNESGSSNTLTYLGQGGHNVFGPKLPPVDQKLEGGNLAMKNSMDKKTPVRVIKKVQVYKEEVFMYDGLYTVDDYAKETSAEGKIVFKFYLNRVPGQHSHQTMLKW